MKRRVDSKEDSKTKSELGAYFTYMTYRLTTSNIYYMHLSSEYGPETGNTCIVQCSMACTTAADHRAVEYNYLLTLNSTSRHL